MEVFAKTLAYKKMLTAFGINGEPTPRNFYMHDANTPNGAWLVSCFVVFLLLAKSLRHFWGEEGERGGDYLDAVSR